MPAGHARPPDRAGATCTPPKQQVLAAPGTCWQGLRDHVAGPAGPSCGPRSRYGQAPPAGLAAAAAPPSWCCKCYSVACQGVLLARPGGVACAARGSCIPIQLTQAGEPGAPLAHRLHHQPDRLVAQEAQRYARWRLAGDAARWVATGLLVGRAGIKPLAGRRPHRRQAGSRASFPARPQPSARRSRSGSLLPEPPAARA